MTHKEAVNTKDSAENTFQAVAGVRVCIAVTKIWRSFIVAAVAAVVGSDLAGAAGTLRVAGIGRARVIVSTTVHITGRICAGSVHRRRAVPVSLRIFHRCVTCDYHQQQR